MVSKRRSGRAAGTPARGPDAQVLLPVLIVAAGLVVYLNSFNGAFVFDDKRYIIENPRIRELLPPWNLLSGRRPVLDLSLAINYAFGELQVAGYHVFNLLVHVLAGVTLYGIVRRTLLHESFGSRFARSSAPLALAVALLWTVHPLQTQSVTYVIQRSESMMGLFYLLTLYCVIRGTDSFRGVWWYGAAVICCALGMGSKGVMVTAPVVVLLYDRVFLSKSFAETLRRRWFLYLGLAASWSVLWVCGITHGVLSSSKKVATVGFSFKGITPLEYALTQFSVLVEYLKLSLWPYPLCLDYAWPVERTAEGVVLPAILVVALLAGTVWALFRKPWLGFLGAWFFLILAPTSSFIPIKDPLLEHRMYLSLAAVIVLAVVGASAVLALVCRYLSWTGLRRGSVGAVIVLMLASSLGYGTVKRNGDYRTVVLMWQDVIARRPDNARAYENLGTVLMVEGRTDEAVEAYRGAVRLRPDAASVRCNLGVALTQQGRLDEATEIFRQALKGDPNCADAHNGLGSIFSRRGMLDQAVGQYREALRIAPRLADGHYNLGLALAKQGKLVEAAQAFRDTIALAPQDADAHYNLAQVLAGLGELDQAVSQYRQALAIAPGHSGARAALEAVRRRQASEN